MLSIEIVFEVVKHRVGRWTWPLASFNLALNTAFAVPAVYHRPGPERRVLRGPGDRSKCGSITINLTIAVIVAIAAWDVIDGFRKAKK